MPSRRNAPALLAYAVCAALGAGCGGQNVSGPGDGAGTTTPAAPSPTRLVFAHYFTPYPISLDNRDGTAASDYYATGYNNPDGERGIHAAYGGLFRNRPLPRAPLAGDWRLQDMETEVRRARAAGLDGFTVDVLSTTSDNWTRLQTLVAAADAVDPTFRIVLMPDATASDVADVNALAAAIASLAARPSVFHLPDGRLVLSAFAPEKLGAAYWSQLITLLNGKGVQVAFVPCFLNLADNAAAFAPISYGFSDWGNRSPAEQGGQAAHAQLAHSYGKIWMQPVSAQDERPNQHIYDEANNTENLRTTWAAAINNGAEWVQIPTWNDYSEGAEIAPSLHTGYAFADLTSYYATWFKQGAAPGVTKDVVYVTSRVQPAAAAPRYPETSLMTPRAGSSPARDAVEVLTFLTAPATVNVAVGPNSYSYSAPAGVDARLFPLAVGTQSAAVVRGGATVAAVAPPWTVTDRPYVQDLQYWGASSAR